MDRDGNLALTFNVADGSFTSPSIRVTGREAADTSDVMMSAGEELQVGTSAQTTGLSPEQRGASNSLLLDPVDDRTYRMAAAFAEHRAWNTRMASVRFPSCTRVSIDLIFANGFESGDPTAWQGPFRSGRRTNRRHCASGLDLTGWG